MDKNLKETVTDINTCLENISITLLNKYSSLMENELTTKQIMIIQLIQKSNDLTISEISNAMKTSPSAVSQIISKLEADNYVKREINLKNRRNIFVKLDTKGLNYFKEQEKIDDMIIDRYYSLLEKEELNQFHTVIKKLYRIVIEE